MKKKHLILLLIFNILSISYSTAQGVIWSENFDSYANGTTVGANNNTDNAAADWTSPGGCTTCTTGSRHWEIRSGVMEARASYSVVYLETESIDLTNFTGVSFSVFVAEQGDLEGLYLGTDDCVDATNQDFADVEYSTDGGTTWVLISNYLGWCGLYASCNTHTLYGDDGIGSGDCRNTDNDWIGTTVIASIPLASTSLIIRLSAINYATTEYIRFDNIEVTYTTALPVELINFGVEVNEQEIVDLQWQTASEQNNDYFTVERSPDGKNWEAHSYVEGQGNSSVLVDYAATDSNPFSGTSYYRLKQTDFDGVFTFSETKTITTALNASESIFVYPNPARDQVTISGSKSELSNVRIFNNLGVDVTSITIGLSAQDSKKVIDISALSAGLYYIKTNTATRMISVY